MLTCHEAWIYSERDLEPSDLTTRHFTPPPLQPTHQHQARHAAPLHTESSSNKVFFCAKSCPFSQFQSSLFDCFCWKSSLASRPLRHNSAPMALNGNIRRSPEYWNGNPPMHDSFDYWVNKHGKDAYKDFKKGHPKTNLSYEGWRQTDQVYGGYLFHIASLVWNEDGNSVCQQHHFACTIDSLMETG